MSLQFSCCQRQIGRGRKIRNGYHGGNTIGPCLVHGDEERTLIGIAVPTNRRTAARWEDADASQMLNAVQGHPEVHALLNVEDEVYIAAALGCTMAILRFPLSGLRPDGDVDLFFAGPRVVKQRMDEVVRAICWQRIAAPYAVGAGFVRFSSEILTDN